MSAVIVGSAIANNQKVLHKSQRSTDVDGLVSLTETYIIRTANIESIEPDKNTTHESFSSSTTKYKRMLVESTSVEPMDGDLSQLVVNYVGLDYSTGLPPAYVTAVARPGAGVFGADISIVVKYINEISFYDLLKAQNLQLRLSKTNLTLPAKRLMPLEINGTPLPPNPRIREYRRTYASSPSTSSPVSNFNYVVLGTTDYLAPLANVAPAYEWIYAGYVQSAMSFDRRGQFNQITEEFTEYFKGSSVFYNSSGLPVLGAIERLYGQSATF